MEVTTVPGPDGVTTVCPVGRVDLLSAPALSKHLSQAVASGQSRLIVDLGGVSFIDSSGLAALVSGLKSARVAGGDLRIAQAGDQVRMVLQLTKLDRVFGLYDTVEAAAANY
jgi:anti-sigma B factor antagonist